jgi:hypothetical protein
MNPNSKTEPYTGPFPRARHSHKCLTCARRGTEPVPVACYKTKCTLPKYTLNCAYCRKDFGIAI